MPVKKGLVAPQNIFIQTIIKKFDGSPDRNFVLGNAQVPDLPIIYCNDGFCALTGYSRAELVQRHCSCDFLCGLETDKRASQDVIEALRATEEKHVEILYYRKDGTTFLCSVLIAPVKNEEGRVVMYIMNLEDVTWSPNKDELAATSKSLGIRDKLRKGRKRDAKERNGGDRERQSSLSSSRTANDADTPPEEGIPLMQIEHPSLLDLGQRSTELSTEPSLRSKVSSRQASLRASSMSELFVGQVPASPTEKLQQMRRHSSLHTGAEAFSLLQARRPSSPPYDPSLWNAELRSCSEQSPGLRGSPIKVQLQPKKTEKVAQVMSLGADVLPEYKLQAPQIHPWTILHYSLFKAFWDWLILFLVIYTAIVTPYMASFVLTQDKQRDKLNANPETRGLYDRHMGSDFVLVIVDYIVDVMFIIDIFINFRTTFVDGNDEVVSHPCRIAVHYLKTWFLIDLLAAIPFELLIMITNTDQTTTLIGLLKTARLLRLVRVARKLDQYFEYGMAVLCLLMCSFALLAHWLACIWYSIGNLERGRNGTMGWLDHLADSINSPYSDTDPQSGPDQHSKYVTALYFTLSSLTSVGFGNVSPNTNAEKIFSICVMLIGSLFYAAIFGNVAAIIARLYSSTSRYHMQIRKMREFIRFHQIPNPLRQRIEDYAHHVWSYTFGIDTAQVLKNFPECLQADICLHLHSNLLNTYPAFQSASQGCLRALALKFKTTHLPPGDYIFHEGDEVGQLFFITRGTVEVLSGDVIMAILGKCDTFGDNLAWDLDMPVAYSRASIRALTYCDLHSISREDLTLILKRYPTFRFKEDMELTYDLRGEEIKRNLSELVCSCTVKLEDERNAQNSPQASEPESTKQRRNSEGHDCGKQAYSLEGVNRAKCGSGSKQPITAVSQTCGCCCARHFGLQAQLGDLSKRLEFLETKLATDMEIMMGLLKTRLLVSSAEIQ